MIPRIKELKPLPDFRLFAVFDTQEKVIYDLKDDMNTIEDFSLLKTEKGLFENVRLDQSRTCVYWSDRIDLPSDTILEYGSKIEDDSALPCKRQDGHRL